MVEAQRELTRLLRARHAHGPEDRGISERCLLGFNSGPPMTPSAYNNNVQIFQSAGHVAILNEMVHNARIIPLDNRPHLPADLRQWVGDSRASWDGDTLVVTTRNFLAETSLGDSSASTHLVERFTRLNADTLLYEFTVSDPTTWSGPWTAQVLMKPSDQPLYEYACHEGNYSMASSLSGARAMEAREAAAGGVAVGRIPRAVTARDAAERRRRSANGHRTIGGRVPDSLHPPAGAGATLRSRWESARGATCRIAVLRRRLLASGSPASPHGLRCCRNPGGDFSG